MRRRTLYPVIVAWLAAWVCCWANAGQAEQPKDKPATLEGNWEGKLTVPGGMKLRLGFTFKQKDGKWSGLMHSPDQGVNDIPLTSVELKEDKVKAEFKPGEAVFEGQLAKDGTTIKGEWRQAGLKLSLELKKVEKVSILLRPQTPKKPYPYKEEEVTYQNPKHKNTLAGSLTLPAGDGPFPVVLLITGSGPQDRDETLFSHKPFLVIADHLTRQGIAVLRVDDRGVGKSSKGTPDDTSADFMEDVLAGVAYLKTRKEIDAKKIGLLGHSEGGMIAPMGAAKSSDIAFIVLLAGPGLPGDQLMSMQHQAILKVSGLSDQRVAWQAGLHRKVMAILRIEKDLNIIREKTRVAIGEEMPKLPPEVRAQMLKALPKPEKDKEAPKLEEELFKEFEAGLKPFATAWFRYFLEYDPRPTLAKVKCPVLAINGELDVQVPAKENLAEIEKAVKAGGNMDVTVKEFPKLNHLFQTCKTGSVAEYAQIDETIAPVVLECISTWIKAHTK